MLAIMIIPSSSPTSFDSPSPTRSRRPNSKGKSVTLADHISNERLIRDNREEEEEQQDNHLIHCQNDQKPISDNFSRLRKQRSCREFNSSNNNTILGRSTSARYSFSENSSMKKASSRNHDDIVPRKLSLDDNSFSSSDKLKKLITQKVIQRANSPTTGYKSSKSQWALSPGRSGSPSMSVESKDIPFSFSTLRPHTTQNKGSSSSSNTVDKILSFSFHLFSSKKSSSPQAVHHLRLLNNRLLHWRFANSKAQAVNHRMYRQVESNFIYALYGFTKLQRSVLQKKMQLEREKLEMKLNFVLHSQMKLLEAWGDMKREHVAAIAVMKECLDSVVCRVPLVEGAKVDIQLASVAQRHATDLTDSIISILSSFSPSLKSKSKCLHKQLDKTVQLLSELTKVIAQEKLLLKEIHNILRNMCVLEIKESSLKCSLSQLKFLVAD